MTPFDKAIAHINKAYETGDEVVELFIGEAMALLREYFKLDAFAQERAADAERWAKQVTEARVTEIALRQQLDVYEAKKKKQADGLVEFNAALAANRAADEAKEKAPGKKIYEVRAEREAIFYVYAENADAAEDIAKDEADEELKDDWAPPFVSVSRVDPKPGAIYDDSVPYGIPDDDDEKTVAEFLAEQLEREREAAAKADFEARQIPLFPSEVKS